MAVRTRSNSDGRALPNGSARGAVALGLLSVLTVPAAVAATRWSATYELLHASVAIPAAIVAGLGAVGLSRRAAERIQRTLGRAGGVRAVRLGRRLGVAGILVAMTAAGAVGVYELLAYVSN